MKRISLGLLVSLFGMTMVSEHALALNPNDGYVQVEFYNHCPFPIRVGQMGHGDFAYINPYQAHERGIGPENQQHLAIAYYGYKHDAHPGFGNMTLAEISFNTNHYWLDYYNISLVDGYNLPVEIAGAYGGCDVATCNRDLNPGCPDGNRIWQNGWTIACTKWNDKDNPNNPAARFFDQACPGAYSWSKDDSKVRACQGQDYRITFCP